MNCNEQSDIRIHKLIAKKFLSDTPQTLLLIGSAKRQGDIWVGLDSQAPRELNTAGGCWAGVERATYANSSEIADLDVEMDNEARDETPRKPFGIHLDTGETFWIARFDFPDHDNLEDRWRKFTDKDAADKPEARLPVVAWRSQNDTRPPGPPMAKHELWFIPIGDSVTRSFLPQDVNNAELFDLGVLLIHGIGNHKVRETLIQFGEPFVSFWERWLKLVTERAATNMPEKARESFHKSVMNGTLHNRQDHEGATSTLDDFRDGPLPSKWSAIPFVLAVVLLTGVMYSLCIMRNAGFLAFSVGLLIAVFIAFLAGLFIRAIRTRYVIWAIRTWYDLLNARGKTSKLPVDDSDGVLCAGVYDEDTLFQTPCSDTPSSTLLRVTLVRGDGGLREAHILMSEACWTEETVYPTLDELRDWIVFALPTVVRMDMRFTWKSSRDDFCELWNGGSQLRAVIGGVIDLAKIALLTPLVFVVAVVVQSALFLLGTLSLVPIEWVKHTVGWTINLLMDTVGQSYAVKTSAVRRNAIMRAVMKDLEWMTPRCRKIVVVSHSQGGRDCPDGLSDAALAKGEALGHGWFGHRAVKHAG